MTAFERVDPQSDARLREVSKRILCNMEKEISQADISVVELLALMARITGSVLAHQNAREMSPEEGWKVILENMKAGNAETVAELVAAGGVARGRTH